MADESPYIIEPLESSRHDRAAFSCGESSLDNYLRVNARKDIQADVAACYIIRPRSDESRIAGYYTLSSCSVSLEGVAAKIVKTSRNYAVIPGMLLGRLAVDKRFQGQKLGQVLLWDALKRVWSLHQQIGIKLVIVDALHEQVAKFYTKYGFVALQDQPLRLYLPVATIGEVVGET